VPIAVRSLNDSRTLYYEFTGRITVDDLRQMAVDEDAYFRALKPADCLDVIADLSALETFPPDLFARLQQARLFAGRQICEAVIVGANAYLRALLISLGIITQRHPFTFRDSPDERGESS